MLVIDQPTLSQLAKTFRRALAVEGVALGHQSSLNLCIAALDVGSPNKVAAILAERPLLLAPPAGLPEPWLSTYGMAVQIARLALWETRQPSQSATSAPACPWPPDQSISYRTASGLLSAACKMVRLTVPYDGTACAGQAMALAPETVMGNAPKFPLLLSPTAHPHPKPDTDGVDRDYIVRRFMAASSHRHDLLGVDPILLRTRFWKAFGETVLDDDLDNHEVMSMHVGMNQAYDLVAAIKGIGAGLSLGSPGMETLQEMLLTAFSRSGLVGIVWPDGQLTSLEDFMNRTRKLASASDAAVSRVPNAVTLAAMEEARGCKTASGGQNGGKFCLGMESLAGRIGLHLFSETRDGQEFHTFDFGADPETADLIDGEFEWLPPSATRNAAVRHALFSLAGCGLDGADGEALEADISDHLGTDIQRDGTEPVGVALLRRAVAELDSTNSAYEEARSLLKWFPAEPEEANRLRRR